METKKRKAEEELHPESHEDDVGSTTTEISKNDKAEIPETADPPGKTPPVSGFSAYAKINPFAAAMASSNAVTASESAFPFPPNKKGGGTSFGMLPPLQAPSPKSPKLNPFSSPSPVHNPFMTFVEGKDEFWSTMAKDGNKNNTESFFGRAKEDKSIIFGSSFSKPTTEEPGSTSAEKEDVAAGDDDTADSSCNNTFTKIYHMPENVTIVTGEEGEECVLQTRAKLFRLQIGSNTQASLEKDVAESGGSAATGDKKDEKSTAEEKTTVGSLSAGAEWIEVGIGPVKILKSKVEGEGSNEETKGSQARLVMRREEKKGGIGTKLMLNVRLNQFVSVAKQADKMLRLLCPVIADATRVTSRKDSSGEGGESTDDETAKLATYLIKTKSVQESDHLLDTMNTYITNTTSESKSVS